MPSKASGKVGQIGKAASMGGVGNALPLFDQLSCFVQPQKHDRIHNGVSRGALEFPRQMKFTDSNGGGDLVQG